MTLQMSYQEKFEHGVEQGIVQGAEQEKIEIAIHMLKDGDISYEKIAMYSGLTLEEVLKLR